MLLAAHEAPFTDEGPSKASQEKPSSKHCWLGELSSLSLCLLVLQESSHRQRVNK